MRTTLLVLTVLWTGVALGNATPPSFSNSEQLSPEAIVATESTPRGTEKTTWLLENGTWQPYRIEISRHDEAERLVSRALTDGSGKAFYCYTYDYDTNGNLCKETLYGNLTGEGSLTLTTDGEVTATENYSKYWEYDDAGRLIRQWEDNGHTTLQLYNDDDQIVARLVGTNSAITERAYFQYNATGRLAESIVDDGQSLDPWDLSGITFRHIQRLQYDGDEITLEHITVDPASHEETLLLRQVDQFNRAGDRIQHDMQANIGDHQYTGLVQYDDEGRPVGYLDSTGYATSNHFDDAGNLILRQEDAEAPATTFTYDEADRLLQHARDDLPTTYSYNDAGKVAAATDAAGNTTHYHYDALNRLISIQQPAIPSLSDLLWQPSETRTFDIADNLIALTDGNGYTTHIHYSAYGKPVKIQYPDGSKETLRYNLDGSLIKTSQDDNIESTKKTTPSSQYTSIPRQNCSLSQTSVVTNERDETVFQKTSTDVDTGNTFVTTCDAMGRIEETSSYNSNGDLLSHKTFRHDGNGNVIRENADVIIDNTVVRTMVTLWEYLSLIHI